MQITMPKDNLHWGEVEHRNLHNLNGALFHQATAEVLFVTPFMMVFSWLYFTKVMTSRCMPGGRQ